MTHTPDALSEQIRLRSVWLRALEPEEREALEAATLREVDERFEAWMDRGPAVGDDGGG